MPFTLIKESALSGARSKEQRVKGQGSGVKGQGAGGKKMNIEHRMRKNEKTEV